MPDPLNGQLGDGEPWFDDPEKEAQRRKEEGLEPHKEPDQEL